MINLRNCFVSYLVLFSVAMAMYSFASLTEASTGDSLDCPCISEDCAYGAIDDCYDDLDPYELLPFGGTAPGSPPGARPTVARGFLAFEAVSGDVSYTFRLTAEGISRYGRITEAVIPRDALAELRVEYSRKGQLFHTQNIELSLPLRLAIPGEGHSALQIINVTRPFLPRIDGAQAVMEIPFVDVKAENTGNTVHRLRARRSSIQSADLPIDD